MLKDTEKVKQILLHGLPEEPAPEIITYPRLEVVIDLLLKTKNEYLYFDVEVDSDLNIFCFALSFNTGPVYSIPLLLPDYSMAYTGLHFLLQALAIAIRDNTLVSHNGCNFDFFVLAYKYRIAIYKVYDTLVANHRIFTEIEKSLGHCISLWTWLQFHKDLGDVPYNQTYAQQTWHYCGLDVYSMRLVHRGQMAYAAKRPGLIESIQQANDSIKPYLITSLTGIRFDEQLRQAKLQENDRLMMQYLRMLEILIGKENLKDIRGKGKSSMPSSNPQCIKYFHDLLGYPVVAKGKEKKDGTRNASLGKKAMFKLRLKHDNPVIDIILAYRETMKESGALKFTPWPGVKIL